MLNSDIEALLAETASHLRRRHEVERGNVLREFTFKMHNQGIAQSSMFDQGKAKIYHEAFEKYADGVWHEMQRVLEQIGFDAYSGCEDDLIGLLKTSLAHAYEADKSRLCTPEAFEARRPKFGAHRPESRFDFHYRILLSKLATEIKIFSKKVRAMKEKDKSQGVTQNNYYLHGPSSRVNIGSTDNSFNIITEPELFSKLREAVETQVPDPTTKARLLKKIEEGAGLPKKSPIFNNWFTQFLALTADCISVVQPFVPALAQLLVQTS